MEEGTVVESRVKRGLGFHTRVKKRNLWEASVKFSEKSLAGAEGGKGRVTGKNRFEQVFRRES